MSGNILRRIVAAAVLCFLLSLTLTALAAPGATVVSRGVRDAYGELPEVDGFTDILLQSRVNDSIRAAANELSAAVQGKGDINYSYSVLMNQPTLLSIIIKADAGGVFLDARGVTVDLSSGGSYGLNELFKTSPDFFRQIESQIGWLPDDKSPFAVSAGGICFVRPGDGREQTVGYETIFNWLDIGKAGYYLDCHRVTAAADGKLLRAKVGNLAILFLESNRTTGYAWQVKNTDYAPTLQFVGTSYFINNSRVGVGGWDMIIFGVAGSGEAAVELEYKRPWEKQPLKTIKIRFAGE